MKTWLDKICTVLEKPKYKNTKYCWVDFNSRTNHIRSCCALGELFLRAKGKPREARSYTISNILEQTYKVPSRYVEMVFDKINRANINKKSKQTIAKQIRKDFEELQ